MKRISLIAFFISFIACQKEYVAENKMKEDVNYLADDKLEGRETGTAGELLAAEYIAERFAELDLEPKGSEGYFQEFTFKKSTDPHQSNELIDSISDNSATGTNVVAYLNNQAENTIIIGAHYDHLGHGGFGSLETEEENAIHNGADDNASGVAVMLNLAGKLKEVNKENNYLFIAFSGEELGLLGSNYYAKNPTISLEQVNYMLNMDMVGRLKTDSTLAVYGTGTSPIFKQTVMSSNDHFKIVENESGVGPSDHTSFYLQDIPVLHFFTGQHDDYHKAGDDIEKLNYEGMAMVSDYIFSIINELDDNGKLTFRKTKDESTTTPRFTVGLGVIPDYLYDGEGMRIDGVREGKPAAKAGLLKGDIVIKLGDSAVVDMNAYMRALSSFSAGDKTKVVVKREEKEIEADIEF